MTSGNGIGMGAGINTHDYKDRVPALIEAGADVLCFDSSDGYSEFQRDAAVWIRKKFGRKSSCRRGQHGRRRGLSYLVNEADLDFVKVGSAAAPFALPGNKKESAAARHPRSWTWPRRATGTLKKTGVYVPVCSDGGLANDTQIIVAMAMGADFVMMGRYFAMTNESPTPKVSIGGRLYKPYWGEGSNRARNWQRYAMGDSRDMKFEEGIDAYVPVVGSLSDIMDVTIAKLKSTMCNSGAITLKEFRGNAVLTRVSQQSFTEGGTSNVMRLDQNFPKFE